jgi:hypothetical protein
MIGWLRRASYTGVLVALTIVVLAGCEHATGGGYITSATGEGKATFAFNGKCTNTTFETETGEEVVVGVVKGQLQYNDKPADVKFHAEFGGTVLSGTGSATPCEDLETNESTEEFAGVYRVSGGPKEAEGNVRLEVTDAGEPGINGDQVTIRLDGGRYSGYFNTGTVQGGNVQAH